MVAQAMIMILIVAKATTASMVVAQTMVPREIATVDTDEEAITVQTTADQTKAVHGVIIPGAPAMVRVAAIITVTPLTMEIKAAWEQAMAHLIMARADMVADRAHLTTEVRATMVEQAPIMALRECRVAVHQASRVAQGTARVAMVVD